MKTPISYFGVFLVSAIGLAGNAFGQASYLAGIPRNEVLICENPEGRITNPAWFNIWVVNHGGVSTGLQQLGMDTLWYIDRCRYRWRLGQFPGQRETSLQQ